MPPASHASLSETRHFIFSHIADLARMARKSGNAPIAIHLEAILAAERARRGVGVTSPAAVSRTAPT